MAWFDETAQRHIANGIRDCACRPCKAYRNAQKQVRDANRHVVSSRKAMSRSQPSWGEWFAKYGTPDQMD